MNSYFIWKLKYDRWRWERTFAKEFDELNAFPVAGGRPRPKHDPTVVRDILTHEIERRIGVSLCDEATNLDIEVPPKSDLEVWQPSDDGIPFRMSTRGRAHLRTLIAAEKARRFEVKTLWITKFWLPLLAALVGIIGALTGLAAVLQHKR